jgi:hypothetical protein
LILRGYLLYLMIRGVGAAEALKAPAAAAPRPVMQHTPAPSTTAPPRLSTEAEKRRLEMSSLARAVPERAVPMAADLRRPGLGAKDSTSIAASALRFVAYRCEINAVGLKAIYSNTRTREIDWLSITSLMLRQMPPDKPWDGKMLLDIIPAGVPGFPVAPFRIFATTYVNYAALPGGQAANTSENIRRLAAFIQQQNPAVLLDPASAAFVQQQTHAQRFVSLAQFAEYDSRYKDT